MDIKTVLNSNDEGKWYEIGESGVEICIRTLKPKEYDFFRKKSEVKTRNVLITDNERLARLCLDAMVTDWKNLEDQGKKYECTRENKITLDENWMKFRLFWSGFLSDSIERDSEIVEEISKN